MPPSRRCPQCSAELPVGAPEGLCPKCLMAAGLESQPNAGSASAAPTTPHPGSFVPPSSKELAGSFPQLEILELLGHGGMGAVYKARQIHLDRLVALKIIRPESASAPGFAERFSREAKTLGRLNHPHIVAVHDFGKVNTTAADGSSQPLYYFLMEYVDGTNLRTVIQEGSLKPREALAIVPQVCEALQYAHDEGIVHRDIKPENILIDKRGRVKIADFGLAKLVAQSPDEFTLTGTHQVMGTPRYMAPEQMEGSHAVDHRADIYSLGVVFYELLTGEVPAGHFDPPSKKVEIDVRLDDVVLRSLAREPERRYQQASEVKAAVETVSSSDSHQVALKDRSSSNHALPPPGMAPRMLLIGGAMVASALCIAAGLGLMLFAFLKESSGSDTIWGWLGGGFGCLIGGAGALAGTWNSYRQLEGAPDLWEELRRTWFDRAIGGYTLAGLLAVTAALVLSFWLPWYPVCYFLLLLGGIVAFQGILFLVIRGLTRRAAQQESAARIAVRSRSDLSTGDHREEAAASKPRGTLWRAWDQWWAQRDRWISRSVQAFLVLFFVLCLIVYGGFSSKSNKIKTPDGDLVRNTTTEFGLSLSPWATFESNPEGKPGWNWEIRWLSWSMAVMLLGYIAWCVNWQIEKAIATGTGKRPRWWDGSPGFAITFWAIVTIFEVALGMFFMFQS